MFFQTRLGMALLWSAIFGASSALGAFLLTGLVLAGNTGSPASVWEAAVDANAALVILGHIAGFVYGRYRHFKLHR